MSESIGTGEGLVITRARMRQALAEGKAAKVISRSRKVLFHRTTVLDSCLRHDTKITKLPCGNNDTK